MKINRRPTTEANKTAEDVAIGVANKSIDGEWKFKDYLIIQMTEALTEFSNAVAEARVKEVVFEHHQDMDGECFTNVEVSLAKEKARNEALEEAAKKFDSQGEYVQLYAHGVAETIRDLKRPGAEGESK